MQPIGIDQCYGAKGSLDNLFSSYDSFVILHVCLRRSFQILLCLCPSGEERIFAQSATGSAAETRQHLRRQPTSSA